jgi:hypothetical protein
LLALTIINISFTVGMWGCRDLKMWGCGVEKMFRRGNVEMPRCEIVGMPGCAIVGMPGCGNVGMPGCGDVEASGCRDVGMPGCTLLRPLNLCTQFVLARSVRCLKVFQLIQKILSAERNKKAASN